MNLYCIRHGESEENIRSAHAGHYDSPLTEVGKAEALHLKKLLEEIKFDKVYSSDLSRAAETQRIAYPNDNVERLSLIREIDVGKEIERVSFEVLEKTYGESYKQNKDTYNFEPYGGENYDMLARRARAFLDILKEENLDNVAAFSHGGFINSVLGVVLNCKVTNVRAFSVNCGVSVFNYKNGIWRLVKWNMSADSSMN